MSGVVWKPFSLGDIFTRSTKLAFKKNQKDLNLLDEPDDEHSIALVSSSREGNGIVGYLENSEVEQSIVSKNKITFDDQWGFTAYQDEDFVITGGHNAILEIENTELKQLADDNNFLLPFMCRLINKITIKTGLFGYSYKINSKFDREIILLPCIEVRDNEGYILDENRKHYTLALDYIRTLMNSAKELKEKKTIELYKAEREKYEAEREKYEAAYLAEKKNLVWLPYTLGSLFNRSSSHCIKIAKKNLDEVGCFDEDHPIKNITASKENNGCSGYLPDEARISEKKKINMLTIASDAAYGGICFYQKDYFVSTGHNNILEIKDQSLKNILNDNEYAYLFLAKMITKIMRVPSVNRFERSIGNDFDREIILLPCLESKNDDTFVWDEQGKHYTLAINYINYIYLTGEIKYYNNLIEKYKYEY